MQVRVYVNITSYIYLTVYAGSNSVLFNTWENRVVIESGKCYT